MKSGKLSLVVSLAGGVGLTAMLLAILGGGVWLPAAQAVAPDQVVIAAAQAGDEPTLVQANPVWTDFDISQHAGIADLYPAVAADDSHASYLVVWREEPFSNRATIWGRIVSGSGDVLTETLIYSSTPRGNTVPWADVAFNSLLGNQYMVVWNADDPYRPEIYGRRVASNGSLAEPAFRIDDNNDHDDFFPAIAHDSANGPYLVVWSERWDLPTPGAQLSGRLLKATGEPLTDTFKIADLANHNLARPAVAFNSTAEQYLVVWNEWYGGSDIITGQLVAKNGFLVGGPFTISTFENTDEAFPDVAYDSLHNEYLVVWHSNLNSQQPDYNIYGKVISATGVPVGQRLDICTATGNQQHPAVEYNAHAGAYLVVWDDLGRSYNYDIYGQWVLGGEPALLGDNVPIMADTSNQGQTYPALAYNGLSHQFLTAWQDSRGSDIYGKRLTGLPYDVGVHPISLWSRPLVIRQGAVVVVGAHIYNRFGSALNDVGVKFYRGNPAAGGTLLGERTVDFGQANRLSVVTVTWDTAGISGDQTLYVVVDPANQIPEMREGNNVLSRTRTIWPPTTDTQAPTCTLIIDNGALETHDPMVNLTIGAQDDDTGVRWMYLREWWATPHLPDAEALHGEGTLNGVWDYRDSGWTRYNPLYATAGYSYTLMGGAGVRYIQVWCRDGAGNISEAPPVWDAINYVPDFYWTLGDGEWHLYRMQWTPGASVTISMTVPGNDADLFVWTPGNTGAPDLVSQNPGPAAHTEIISFTAAAGVYQIVPYGVSPVGGQYMIEWSPSELRHATASALSPWGSQELPSTPPLPPDATPPADSAIAEFRQYVYLPVVLRQ